MKLLSIVHGPVFGGGNNQTVRLAGPLRERGWETLAMVPDIPEADATQARMLAGGLPTGRMELHRLRRSPDPREHLELLGSFRREVARLRRLIRNERIDLVQAFGDTNPHLALAGHLEGKAVVWHLYDTVSPPRVRPLTMALVTRLADVIMTTGRRLADEYPGATELGIRCVTVYPPVDPDEFVPSESRRAEARAELGVPVSATLIGAVGNRNPTKGHDLLAQAIASVRARGIDVWCRVLGADSPAHAREMAGVDARIAELGLGERMTITDPGDRVAQLMPAFDVLALSSVPRSEGVPTVILEAMSCGLPVVATDVGAVSEVVEEGVTGHVVPPLHPARMADALAALVRDPGRRDQFGRAGRERVVERYATERCADTYARAYEAALAYRAARDG